MDHDPIDDELGSMVSNPRMARVVKDILRGMQGGSSGPVFQEMAKDLLEGRISLRELGRTDAYGQAFAEAHDRHEKWKAEQNPEDLKSLVEDARSAMEDDDPAPR